MEALDSVDKNKDTQLEITKKDEPKQKPEVSSILDNGIKLNYDEDTQQRLIKEVYDEIEAIQMERDEDNLDNQFDNADNQYKGDMPRRADSQFNLNIPITKTIVDDVARTIVSSHLEVDPMVSIRPRPELARNKNGWDICSKQEEFIDYAFDQVIPYDVVLRQCAYSSAKKKVGIIRWEHKVRRMKRKRQQTYTGEYEIVQGPDGQEMTKNIALEQFTKDFSHYIADDPDAYMTHIKALEALKPGKTYTIDVEYYDTIYNDPFPKYVDPKNFYVRRSCSTYEDMCETRLITERTTEMTYWDIKKLEKDYGFINVDELLYDEDEDKNPNRKERDGAKTQTYNIMEHVYYFQENDNNDEKKIIFYSWEDRKIYLGGVYYPYSVVDCYYVPHYMKNEDGAGFYKGCVTEDIRDLHIAQNAVLNFTLEAVHTRNMVTPITKDQDVIDQFAGNDWVHGLPLIANPASIDFLQKRMPQIDTSSLLALYQEIGRSIGQVSGRSDLRSGKESAIDPSAPAAKTAMLLQQSGVPMKDYAKLFSIGFSWDIAVVLGIYYDIAQQDIVYLNKRQAQVTGDKDVFSKITRNELVARTAIQPMAHAYDFDRLEAKKEDLAMYQILQAEVMFQRNPDARYFVLKNLVKGWSTKWAMMADKILPSPEDFKQQQLEVAIQATQIYLQKLVEDIKLKGEADPQAEEVLALTNDLIAQMVSQRAENQEGN